MRDEEIGKRFVSRGGLKLEAALERFTIDVTGDVCVDLGCNVGGFTDCLLKRGAARVCAVDTGYGTLAWALRQDGRVTVRERSNALHVEPGEAWAGAADLVVIDLGWTRQVRAIPAAMRWLKPGGKIVSLVKPHYEMLERLPRGAVLGDEQAAAVFDRVLEEMDGWGARVIDSMASPVRGGKGKGKGKKASGNREYLVCVERDVG